MSPRAREVAAFLDTGLTVRQIARRLGLRLTTVRSYASRASTAGYNDDQATRLGSAALLAAIKRHHPEQLLMRPGRRA